MNMYQVVDTTNKSVVAEGFAEREQAKPARNKMNDDASSPSRFIVSRGSDHPRGQSFGPVATQRKLR